jgi:hypothetical protein
MEFITKTESFMSEPFAVGSCVNGTIIDGIFVKGSCVSQEEKNEELVISLPKLNIDVTRGWIAKEKYAFERFKPNPYFKGPTYESNWLIRKAVDSKFGAFAVGGYPDYIHHLHELKAAELETFVCLNSEYGKVFKGKYFRQYANDLLKANFIYEPINDMGTVKDETVIALAKKIIVRLSNGEGVYLHCAGGHGRTGTVALVVLHMLYPALTEIELFEFVQYAHDQRGGNYFGPTRFIGQKMIDMDPLANYFAVGQVPSPQTIEQRDQVRRINKKL